MLWWPGFLPTCFLMFLSTIPVPGILPTYFLMFLSTIPVATQPVDDDWEVPQDSCLLSLHHSLRLMLIPTFCFHFDAIVPAYVQVQLGSYLVVPVKVLICC